MVKRKSPPAPSDVRDRLAAMAAVASRFSGWRPAREVLTRVRAVPTDLIQIDYATRCGGWPLERFVTLHGPSNEGKTMLCHGLGLSFLKRGHYYAFIDAEYTTPVEWLSKLMGAAADHPGFVAMRPRSFEQCVDDVRRFVTQVAAARAKGDLEEDVAGLIVVDSVRKLVPEELMSRISKTGASGDKGSVDGYSGRAAQYKAALWSQWLDELVPLLYHARMSMIAIAREADDPTADTNDFKFDRAWKVQGAKALVYDASMVARITRQYVKRKVDGEDRVVAEKHRVRVWKTKIGGKEGQHTDGYFYTGLGVDSPEGFDVAADALSLALRLNVVAQDGAWYAWGRRKWQGESRALAALRASPELLAELLAELRGKFEPADGGGA